jgi:hypothetical protein
MTAPSKFPCTACGLCCRHIDSVLKALSETDIPAEAKQFPHRVMPDGSCSKLTVEGLCSIYETRPLICRVDEMADKMQVDKTIFYEFNAGNCNSLQESYGFDEKYRVRLKAQ